MVGLDFLRKHWRLFTMGLTALAIACVAALVVQTIPPFTIVMATGPEGSAYYELGKRYRAKLAESGVKVRLVTTAGSPENLALLRAPRSGVNVSLLRGGA